MTAWDILLTTTPVGLTEPLDVFTDRLMAWLDSQAQIDGLVISGSLNTGQVEVHFELHTQSDHPFLALGEGLALLNLAVAAAGGEVSHGDVEMHSTTTLITSGFQVSPVIAAAVAPQAAVAV